MIEENVALPPPTDRLSATIVNKRNIVNNKAKAEKAVIIIRWILFSLSAALPCSHVNTLTAYSN